MIDLILWADTQDDIAALFGLGARFGLVTQDPDTQEVKTAHGVEFSWWAGSGKLLRSPGTYDREGNETAAPVFLPGTFLLVRLHSAFGEADRIEPADPTAADIPEWERSRMVKHLHDNGTPGTAEGLDYIELQGVRFLRRATVEAKLAEWGVPSHRFA